jgi:methionyl aminopeptidase
MYENMPKDIGTLSNGVNIYGPTAREGLKSVASIASMIRDTLVNEAKAGVTTLYLENLADQLLKENNCSPLFKGYHGYPFITCISVNEFIVHGFPTNRKLEDGDVLSIDLGVKDNLTGLCSDTARTLIIGEDSTHSEIVNLGKTAFDSGLEQAVIGNKAADIGFAIFKEITKNRVKVDGKLSPVYKIFNHFQGHGIGLELHEAPSVPNWGSPDCGQPLLEGMCICIEPVIMYNCSKVLKKTTNKVAQFLTHDMMPSAHYENQILITNEGPIVLT